MAAGFFLYCSSPEMTPIEGKPLTILVCVCVFKKEN